MVYSYTEDLILKIVFIGVKLNLPIAELMKIDPTLTNADLEDLNTPSWYDYYNVAQFYENDIFTETPVHLCILGIRPLKRWFIEKNTR